MGHADLRIRERTMPAVADRAYELLRNRAALSAFVQMRLERQHAAAADRAALDLEDAPQPARLVVTREGHAVTCLGPGMVTDAPVIPWPETRAYLDAQQHALRTRLARARAQEEDGESALSRVYTHPHRLTRAESDTLVMLAPLLVDELDGMLLDVGRVLDILLRRLEWDLDDRVQHGAADAGFRMTRACALLLLATQQERRARLMPLDAILLQDATVARLGWWVLMAQPRRSLGAVRELLDELASGGPQPGLPYALLVQALAGRFPWLEEEAFPVVCSALQAQGSEAPTRERFHATCLAVRRQLRAQAVNKVWTLANGRLLEAGTPVTATREAALEVGNRFAAGDSDDLAGAMEALGAAYADLARAWDPLRGAHAQPRWCALPADRVPEEEQSRADTWRELIARFPAPLDARLWPMAVASTLAPPEALVPDDRSRKAHTQRDLLRMFVNVELAGQVRARNLDAWTKTNRTPVTAAEKPGPNAPCTCGSGKKYKKCCGAA